MHAYFLVPGHHICARRLPGTSGSRTADHRWILYEWGLGSAKLPETDVWLIKSRRLNILESHVSNPNRRLFYIVQTSVLGGNSLEPIQTSESIETDVCSCKGLKPCLLPRNRRLFLRNQTSDSGRSALCTLVHVHTLPASPWRFLCLSYADFYGF